MDLLFAKLVPVVTDCMTGELEKLGGNCRLALRVAKDPRWQRLQRGHSGTYADNCIISRVLQHRIYLFGTNDKHLRRRLRKIPGFPLAGAGKESTLKGFCTIDNRAARWLSFMQTWRSVPNPA